MSMNNFQFSIFNFQKKQGFTLIETLVAVSILTLSVAGPLYTASSVIVAAENARNQLTASHLAQEGIEYVRWMRDNEYLAAYQTNPMTASTASWTEFLTGTSDASITLCRTSKCMLDPAQTMSSGIGSTNSLQPCGDVSHACTRLYLSDNNIYTQQATGEIKPFTRTIQVIDIPGTEGTPLYPDKRIISTVSWNYHSTPYTITITSHLTPWQ